jgi:hypothetical protein
VIPQFYKSVNIQPKRDMKAMVVSLECEIGKLPQVELPVEHFFIPHVYARQMTIFKGAALVGRVHQLHVELVLFPLGFDWTFWNFAIKKLL